MELWLPGQTEVRKVKAHTDEADVRTGRITAADRAGNDRADRLAKAGAAMHALEPAVREAHLERRSLWLRVRRWQAIALAAVADRAPRPARRHVLGGRPRPQTRAAAQRARRGPPPWSKGDHARVVPLPATPDRPPVWQCLDCGRRQNRSHRCVDESGSSPRKLNHRTINNPVVEPLRFFPLFSSVTDTHGSY